MSDEAKTFRKNKSYTPEQKERIIAYAKEHGISSVKAAFDVWPENVRYWMDPELKKKSRLKLKERYKKLKNDADFIEKNKQYRQHRQQTGISRKKHLEWISKLTPEQKQQRLQYTKQHRLDNLEHYKKLARARNIADKLAGKHRIKYHTNLEYKLKCNLREHVRQAVKYATHTGKQYNKQWFDENHPGLKYLGCTIDEFVAYIESKFTEGMSWDNHGKDSSCWHLDHIRPLAHIKDITDEELIKKLCHYTNYQPLWAPENHSKQDKWVERELIENKLNV